MIHERRRLIPTMIAVIIGVAFVASTLMLMDSIKAYTLRIQAAAVGDATAVVTAKEPSKPMSSITVDKVAAVPGVTSVEQTRNAFLQRTDNGRPPSSTVTWSRPIPTWSRAEHQPSWTR